MRLRNASILRPIIAILAIAMLAVALACASEEPTSEQVEDAQPTPTTPAASTPLTVGQPTATPVSDGTMADLTWINRYLQSPGYDPEWGEPKTGVAPMCLGPSWTSAGSRRPSRAAATITAAIADSPGTPCSASIRGRGTLAAIEGDLVETLGDVRRRRDPDNAAARRGYVLPRYSR